MHYPLIGTVVMTAKLSRKFCLFLPWPSWLDVQEKEAKPHPRPLSKTRELPVNTSPGADGNYDRTRRCYVATGPTTTIAFNEYEFDFGT